MEDEKIVERIRNKDETCLKEMISLYNKLVYSIVYRFIADVDPQAVEEIVSDTFFDLWCKVEKIDLKRGSLKNLICLIARSKALNHRKALNKGQYLMLSEDETEEGTDPESQILEQENFQEILDVIREQKEPVSTIFIMRFLYNYSITEIAEKLQMKRSQIDNHLSRGRKRLLEKLEKAQ